LRVVTVYIYRIVMIQK